MRAVVYRDYGVMPELIDVARLRTQTLRDRVHRWRHRQDAG